MPTEVSRRKKPRLNLGSNLRRKIRHGQEPWGELAAQRIK